MNTASLDLTDVGQFVRAYYVEGFKPLAWYDKRLDCIRVQIKDCSFTEQRLSKIFTVLQANHDVRSSLVGFTIKGVRHLFTNLGLQLTGIVSLVEILDGIVKAFPDEAVVIVKEEFADSGKVNDLTVDFSQAA